MREIGERCFLDCRQLQLLVILNDETVIGGEEVRSQYFFGDCTPVIAGRTGSTAERLAASQGIIFEDLSAWNEDLALDEDKAIFTSDASGVIVVPWYNLSADCPVRSTEGAAGSQITALRLPFFEKEISRLEFENMALLERVEFTGPLRAIGERAFQYCYQLSSVTFPEGLESIGQSAFFYSGLKSAVLPDSVTYLGNRAFLKCSQLSTLVLSRSLSTLPLEAFSYTALQEIIVPGNIRTLDKSCLSCCSSLKSIVLEPGVRYINCSVFAGCDHLQTIHLPESVSIIRELAFSCPDLQEIWVANPDMLFETSAILGTPLSNHVVIHCCAGSTAQTYAEEQGNPFEVIQ
ncbi:MAG: leucine-rich repeat protein [Clostridia bacterium]|nr:leucine-rich repeat protein [Clostridia bacterium]